MYTFFKSFPLWGMGSVSTMQSWMGWSIGTKGTVTSVSAFDKSKHESDGEVIALTPEDEDLIKLEAAAQVVNENQKRTSFTMPNEQISPLELKSKNIEFRPWWEQ